MRKCEFRSDKKAFPLAVQATPGERTACEGVLSGTMENVALICPKRGSLTSKEYTSRDLLDNLGSHSMYLCYGLGRAYWE